VDLLKFILRSVECTFGIICNNMLKILHTDLSWLSDGKELSQVQGIFKAINCVSRLRSHFALRIQWAIYRLRWRWKVYVCHSRQLHVILLVVCQARHDRCNCCKMFVKCDTTWDFEEFGIRSSGRMFGRGEELLLWTLWHHKDLYK